MGVSRVDLTVSSFHTHDMRILTILTDVTSTRAVAAQANAITVINGVPLLAAPHALAGHACSGLGDAVLDGLANLADSRLREGGGNVKGGVNMTLQASNGVGPRESGGATIHSLSLDF